MTSTAHRSGPDVARSQLPREPDAVLARPLPPGAGALLEAATAAASAAEFRAAAAAWLARHTGAEAVLLARLSEDDRATAGLVGLGPAWLARLTAGMPRYGSDLAQIAAASLRGGGFLRGRDTDLEDWARRAGRAGFEEELVFPIGLRHGTAAALRVRDAQVGSVLLGRERASGPFTDAECDALDAVLPILALGEAVHAPPAASPAGPPPTAAPADPPRPPLSLPRSVRRASISPRERDVLGYLVLGLQNREIGVALGTSVNTIRKQVASLFGKLEVASRAELVAVALREGLVPDAGA